MTQTNLEEYDIIKIMDDGSNIRQNKTDSQSHDSGDREAIETLDATLSERLTVPDDTGTSNSGQLHGIQAFCYRDGDKNGEGVSDNTAIGVHDTVQESSLTDVVGSDQDETQSDDSGRDMYEAELSVGLLPSSPKVRDVRISLPPPVDSPEKIVICIDISSEMEVTSFKARAGDIYTSLKIMKKSVAMFIKAKAILDRRNQFALVTMTDTAEWLCDFTDNTKEILYILDSLDCPTAADSLAPQALSIKSLYDVVFENVELPGVDGDITILPPPFILRMLLVYGRSHSLPDITPSQSRDALNDSPYFFIDCVYLHEPVAVTNQCEMIYELLTSLDRTGSSYIFETARNPTKVYDNMAKLLSHPLQRLPQCEARYKLYA